MLFIFSTLFLKYKIIYCKLKKYVNIIINMTIY